MQQKHGVQEQGFTGHGRGFFKAFLIEAALYLGIGSYAVLAHGVPPLRVVLISLLVFVSLRFFLTLGNWLPTWKNRSPKRAEHEIGCAATVAMLLREWWAAILTYPFLFAFEPWLAPNNPPAGLPHKGLPVVLVPGFFTNRGYLYAWRKYLLRNGYGKVYCVSPEPIFAGVEPNAEHLSRFVDEVLAETGAPRVILIGHSMGGLVIRLYLHRFGGLAKAALAMAVGSPFKGTVLAEGKDKLGPIVAQLTNGNPWAMALVAEAEAQPCPIPFIAIWSPHDSIVSPQDNSRVAAHYGREITLPGMAHMEMVNSPQVMRVLKQELDAFNSAV